MVKNFIAGYRGSVLLFLWLCLGSVGQILGQTIILEQDFDTDTSWVYSSDIATFDHGWGRDGYFGTISVGSAHPLDNRNFSGYIFAENDLDDEGDNGTEGFAHITFRETDISDYDRSQEMVLVTFDYDIVGYNASGDDVYYQIFYDGIGLEKEYLLDGGVDPNSKKGKEKISISDTVSYISLVLSIRNNGVTGYSGFDNFKILAVPIKTEPGNHVTDFIATPTGFSKVELTWTDAGGDVEPDGYIIIGRKGGGAFNYPVDGVDSFQKPDWSNGQVEAKVESGEQKYIFSGLEGITPYKFTIIPYTNSGNNIDYKTDSAIPVVSTNTLPAPPIIINEFLADPDAETGDANGDAVVGSYDDEFVEIINVGNEDLDISGWIIADAASDRHIFMYPTILKPDQAAVVFGGGYPMGDFGGAYIATASSGSLGLNNSRDDIIIKTGEGQIALSYNNNAGDNQSLNRFPEATEGAPLVKHTTIDGASTSFSPGTLSDGSCFGTAYAILYGEEGWRMIGSPVNGVPYSELLSAFWTQGIADGAKSSEGTANILTHNGTEFIEVEDLNRYPKAGEGFIMYVYGDDNHDGYDDYFPKLFYTNAVENSGHVSPDISKNSSNNAWTLLANPYASPINFDLLTKNEVSQSVYVYDHFTASYKVWNGITGSLKNGDITPFQGFWVQQRGSNPEVIIEESDKVETSLNRFYKKTSEPVIELIIQHKEMRDNAHISFSNSGEMGIDEADAYKLSPLDYKTHVSLSTVADSSMLSINNLPADLNQAIEIPIQAVISEVIEGGDQLEWYRKGGEIVLMWDQIGSIPESWDISIQDNETGHVIDLRNSDQYLYHQKPPRAGIARHAGSGLEPGQVAYDDTCSRLSLIVSPKTTDFDTKEIPGNIILHQNYPNPFNSATNIGFGLPYDSEIKILVYDVTGQTIATLADGYFKAGEHSIVWNAKDLNSGTYFCELKTATQRLVNKMIFLK